MYIPTGPVNLKDYRENLVGFSSVLVFTHLYGGLDV